MVNQNLVSRTKKYPYSKGTKVTTTDMKKIKRSTLGVLPNPRDTTELDELNVLLEGQCPQDDKIEAQSPEQQSISRVEEANLIPPTANQGEGLL